MYLDRKLIMKLSRICRILMKICWDIENKVPDLILSVPGADSGVKNPKNPKYVTRNFSKKSAKIQKYIEI